MTMTHHHAERLVRWSACVLYEPDSGEIRHIHHTVVLQGGHDPSDQESEAMARESLQRRGRAHTHLKALHVPHDHIKPFGLYRVDVEMKRLVERSP